MSGGGRRRWYAVDEFNAYANGGWMKNHEAPADRGSYGTLAILSEWTRETARAGQRLARQQPLNE